MKRAWVRLCYTYIIRACHSLKLMWYGDCKCIIPYGIMCLCMYAHIHICVCVCVCTYIPSYIHAYIHAYIHTYIHTRLDGRTFLSIVWQTACRLPSGSKTIKVQLPWMYALTSVTTWQCSSGKLCYSAALPSLLNWGLRIEDMCLEEV
jgi:hypothetical protein